MSEDADDERSSGWKRPLLIVLATAPIAALAFIVIFVGRGNIAFDESRCPYREHELREVSETIDVREDTRRCQEDVEEHRWVLLRHGEEPLELGRRRLPVAQYAGYRWTATEEPLSSDAGVVEGQRRVKIEIHTRDLAPRTFREPAPGQPR